MKKTIYILFLISTLLSCSSPKYPTVEESDKKIHSLSSKIPLAEAVIKGIDFSSKKKNDFVLRIKKAAFNKILSKISYTTKKDVEIKFLKSEKIIKEENSAFGISYTNHIDINSGSVTMDLTNFSFRGFDGNIVRADIEINGSGGLSVSGKYTGIPASISPGIKLNLKEKISFSISADKQNIILRPMPKKLILKATAYFEVLSWEIPWTEEIELDLTSLLNPVYIPIIINTDFEFPLPAEEFSDEEKIIMAPYILQISNTDVNASDDVLEIGTDFNLKKK